jgi:hypothetical protein
MVATQRKVYVFWDNSNVFIGAKKDFYAAHKKTFPRNARLDFENLFKLAHANRPVAGGFCAGSVPPELRAVWSNLEKKTGVKLELFERGKDSGKEQGVDQALQVRMLRVMADEAYPQIAVLLTGDGKGYLEGVGFHADLERLHKKGWGIEVVSWQETCAARLREFAKQVGLFISMDTFVDNLVFEQGLTHVKPLDLRGRAKLS